MSPTLLKYTHAYTRRIRIREYIHKQAIKLLEGLLNLKMASQPAAHSRCKHLQVHISYQSLSSPSLHKEGSRSDVTTKRHTFTTAEPFALALNRMLMPPSPDIICVKKRLGRPMSPISGGDASSDRTASKIGGV